MKNRGMKRNSGYIGWRQRSKWKNQTSHSLNYRHINALTVSNTYPAISIHAPAKGATSSVPQVWERSARFNPRSCERSDVQIEVSFSPKNHVSIHAPAKGATFKRYWADSEKRGGNQRDGERSDLCRVPQGIEGPVSIHAPAKGATYKQLAMRSGQYVSIHAPAKGATVLG